MNEIVLYIRRVMAAENRAIANAVRTGADRTLPCGVRVRRSFDCPIEIIIDAAIPPWEVWES